VALAETAAAEVLAVFMDSLLVVWAAAHRCTLAGAVAAGHRVVIVVATDGHVTAVPDATPARLGELRASAAALGVHRVEHLGYADSGHGAVLYPDPPDRRRFVRADTEEAAGQLAALPEGASRVRAEPSKSWTWETIPLLPPQSRPPQHRRRPRSASSGA
jgi:hypothetical protein